MVSNVNAKQWLLVYIHCYNSGHNAYQQLQADTRSKWFETSTALTAGVRNNELLFFSYTYYVYSKDAGGYLELLIHERQFVGSITVKELVFLFCFLHT